ncbi:hypothetical protein J6590_086684 [Homalodisca vitripennis]|nr:hypothetical protein J6590_086684 [Homalodisca vitripennis]
MVKPLSPNICHKMHFANPSQKETTSAYDTNIESQPNLSESRRTSSNSRSEFCISELVF